MSHRPHSATPCCPRLLSTPPYGLLAVRHLRLVALVPSPSKCSGCSGDRPPLCLPVCSSCLCARFVRSLILSWGRSGGLVHGACGSGNSLGATSSSFLRCTDRVLSSRRRLLVPLAFPRSTCLSAFPHVPPSTSASWCFRSTSASTPTSARSCMMRSFRWTFASPPANSLTRHPGPWTCA